MLKQILFGGESGLSFIGNAGIALLRIFAGVSLSLAHGWGKVPVKQQFIDNVTNLGFPAPAFFAWAAALSEFAGGAFLALGLFTRISGFFIVILMLVAVFGVHINDPYGKQELAMFYLFTGLCFMLKGAGDWSLDAYFRRR
jgi:putative oxidoreductase